MRAPSRLTFAEYATGWISTYKGRTRRGVSETTRRDYRRALGLDDEGKLTGTGAIKFFGRMQLPAITPQHIREYADTVASTGVARDTIRLALAPVKALLATALEDGLIRANPAAGIRLLSPMDQMDEEKIKALLETEIAAVLAKIPAKVGESRPRLFFEFLVHSGCRIGEAVEVRFDDIDFGRRWLHVRRRYYKGRVGLPKGSKTRRVRLTDGMARALWQLQRQRKAAADDLVFVSERGQRIDQSNWMSRVLKPAAVEAGIGEWVNTKDGQRAETWVGYHTFRHSAATIRFRQGWNAVQVQKFLGHSDPGFTLRRYIHLLPEDLPDSSFMDAITGNSLATRPAETGRNEAAPRSLETDAFAGKNLVVSRPLAAAAASS